MAKREAKYRIKPAALVLAVQSSFFYIRSEADLQSRMQIERRYLLPPMCRLHLQKKNHPIWNKCRTISLSLRQNFF